MQPFRWGIIGPGSIAHSFATGLQAIPDAQLVAVGSRSQEKADAFGEQYGAPKRYASYQAVAEDPDVDAVYIASPHSEHKSHALLCLEAGKPVLCEKPFTINAAQARDVVAAARQNDVFLMEAIWTRFFPVMGEVRRLIAEKAIGDLRMIQADFGFQAGFNPEARLFNPQLGGGALLDVGVYPISLASMLLGKPDQITGLANLGQSGVDEQSAFVLGYAQGVLAVLSTAIITTTPWEATILGSAGSIKIPHAWWKPTSLIVSLDGQESVTKEMPIVGNGYNYQAVEVMECVRAGKKESTIIPLDETISIMETMDTLRAQWGLKYPMEV